MVKIIFQGQAMDSWIWLGAKSKSDIRIVFWMESLQGISVIFRSIQNNLVCISCPNTCILDIHLTVKYSNKEVPYLVQTSISSSIPFLLRHLYLLVKPIERNSPETGYWTTNIQTCPHAYISNIIFHATNYFPFYHNPPAQAP